MLYGGLGSLFPFLNLFYRRQGLGGAEIGMLGTIAAAMGLVASLFWGHWSDRSIRPKRLLLVALLGSAFMMGLLSHQSAFWIIAMIVAMNSALFAGVEPLSSAMALELQQERKNPGFGSVRLAGSLGWAVLAYAVGLLVERTGLFSAFAGYVFGMLATLIALSFLHISRSIEHTSQKRTGTRQMISKLIQDRAMTGLTLALIIGWVSNTGTHQFGGIYLDELGAGESIIGLATTLAALMEIPAMLWADHLLKRFGSYSVLRASYGVRILLMAAVLLLPRISTILATRAIGGISYSFFIVASVVFIKEKAPSGRSATALALYTVTLRNLVSMVASPLGGILYDAFGAYWLYPLSMVGAILSWGILGISRRHAHSKL